MYEDQLRSSVAKMLQNKDHVSLAAPSCPSQLAILAHYLKVLVVDLKVLSLCGCRDSCH